MRLLRRHYCWVIVFCAALLVFCCQGLSGNCFSIYLSYMRSAWGYTNSQASLFNTVRSLFSLLGVFIMGWFYKRVNLRAGLSLWFFVSALAYCLGALADRVFFFYLMSALFGLTFGAGGFAAVAMMVRRWFKDRLGLAVGLFSCSTGIATIVAPSIITRSLESRGLRYTFVAEGIVVALMALTFFLLARSEPADIGAEPYTAAGGTRERKKHVVTLCTSPLAGREWVLVIAAFFFAGMGPGPALANFSLHFTNCGFAPLQAASAISMYGACIGVGKLVFGYCVDRFGGRRASGAFLIIMIAGLLILCTLKALPVYAMMLAGTGLMGFGYTTMSVGTSIWAADMNPPELYDETIRRFQLPMMVGGVVGCLVPGPLADLFGSYVPAYAIAAFCGAFFLLTLTALYRRKTRLLSA